MIDSVQNQSIIIIKQIRNRLMNKFKKWAYIAFMGAMTCSAVSACYWQGKKYMISSARWQSIKLQLNKQHPEQLSIYEGALDLYPFKYLKVEGTLSEDYERVQRRKQNRMGYLVIRALRYKSKDGKQKEIAALQGWCEEQFKYVPKQALQSKKLLRGILRQKQKKDFIHDHFKKQDLQRFKMNTYINLEQINKKLHIVPTSINEQFYLQILRPMNETEYQSFPYQYSVDNFQLPYLTPDKHLSYATFWGCCSILGLSTIIRVLRFK